LPYEIFDLFVGENDESKHFREHIRQYNSAMSFVSFGSHITLPPGMGLIVLKYVVIYIIVLVPFILAQAKIHRMVNYIF
jgi:hypothetical protein